MRMQTILYSFFFCLGMTILVALLEQGGHFHVSKLIEGENWEKAILVTTEQQKKSFACNKPHSFILINEEWPAQQIIETITVGLKGLWGEVGLNFVSGSGKEHMALVAAVIRAGLSFRLVALTREGIKEL